MHRHNPCRLQKPNSNGDFVIKPTERTTSIFSFCNTMLLALYAYVNRDDVLVPRDGYFGEILCREAVSVSEGAVWVLAEGPRAGEVVQIYPRGKNLHYDWSVIHTHEIAASDPCSRCSMVIAPFANMLTADRAMQHATARILPELEAFRALVGLSDEALEHAIGTNLETTVEVEAHARNVEELHLLVRSGGELAEEIRAFLKKMRSRNDIRNRRNTYRMVLIVRAVQRRAKTIGEAKGGTLQAITTIGLDVARYVGAVTGPSGRVVTELSDPQPWWIGQNGNLSSRVADKRRQNFIEYLEERRNEFRAMKAHPFRRWTFRAADEIDTMLSCYRDKRYDTIYLHARKIVSALRTVLLREQVSRAIMTTHRHDSSERAFVDETLKAAQVWARESAPSLDIGTQMNQVVQILDITKSVNSASTWIDLQNALREIEQAIDNIT